ncbi:MAG: MEDS domain-containing protein, partial [Candidatus Helarchaeota archaeon]
MHFGARNHYCWLYDDEKQHQKIVTEFINEGLQQNEKIIYVADSHSPEIIKNYLKSSSFSINSCIKSGQLNIFKLSEFFLKKSENLFSKLIPLIKFMIKNAVDEGYSGLRATGEMSCIFHEIISQINLYKQLLEYESNLNTIISESNLSMLCQYDIRSHNALLFTPLLSIHPKIILRTEIFANEKYIPPSEVKSNLAIPIFQKWFKNESYIKLKEEVETLKELDREKNQLLDELAHEIRNPLSSILGFTELLMQDDANLSPFQKEAIEIISRNVNRIIRLISLLLNKSRLEKNQFVLKKEPFCIDLLINSVVDELSFNFKQKAHKLHLNVPENLIVVADKDQLYLVILNLLSNAIKYTPPKGDITIHVRKQKSKLHFSITDTGIGFTPEEKSHLFKKFSKIKRALKEERGYSKGVGLG